MEKKNVQDLSLATIEYHYYFDCECGDGHAFIEGELEVGDQVRCGTCGTWYDVTRESLGLEDDEEDFLVLRHEGKIETLNRLYVGDLGILNRKAFHQYTNEDIPLGNAPWKVIITFEEKELGISDEEMTFPLTEFEIRIIASGYTLPEVIEEEDFYDEDYSIRLTTIATERNPILISNRLDGEVFNLDMVGYFGLVHEFRQQAEESEDVFGFIIRGSLSKDTGYTKEDILRILESNLNIQF